MTLSFGHSATPALDFQREVDACEADVNSVIANGYAFDRAGAPSRWEATAQRIERAMEFRVGGCPDCVAAKQRLRECETRLVNWAFRRGEAA